MTTPSSHEIPVIFDEVRWNIKATPKQVTDGINIELSWGWTAGMTPEEIQALDNTDIPTGHKSVITTIDMAKELCANLTQIIKEHEEAHIQLREKYHKERLEKYGDALEKAFPLK